MITEFFSLMGGALRHAFWGETATEQNGPAAQVKEVEQPKAPDPRDLSRLPFTVTSTVITNVFRQLKDVSAEDNMALEARVGATIWLLTLVDKNSKSYAESMYPFIKFEEVQKISDDVRQPSYESKEFVHWLCLVGQKALTDSTMGFRGEVIIDDRTGTQLPRWQSVSEAQRAYKLNREDQATQLHLAKGDVHLSDKWTLNSYADFKDESSFISNLTIGNITFHRSILLEWCNRWDDSSEKTNNLIEQKRFQELYEMFASLEALVPFAKWQVPESVHMGEILAHIWRNKDGRGGMHGIIRVNDRIASYCEVYLQVCLALGKKEEANTMFDNCKALISENTAIYGQEGRAFVRLKLCQYTSDLNRNNDKVELMKQAARDILSTATSTSDKNTYVFPSFIVAKLWQKGLTTLDGQVYSEALIPAFKCAIKAYKGIDFFSDMERFEEKFAESGIKEAFGRVSLDEMQHTIQIALNQLVFDNSPVHSLKKLSRTTSCSSLLFKPENPKQLAETTSGSIYEPVKLAQ